MKNILIALDYAPASQQVAEAGYATALAMNASITLLHVLAEPAYYTSTAYSPIMGFGGFTNLDLQQPEIATDIQKAAVSFLDHIRTHLGDGMINIMVKQGSVDDCITNEAKTLNAVMIVMGAKSRNWLQHVLLGSVTLKVLGRTQTPLLIIPEKNAVER